jgi:hypothetical protein
MAIKPHIAKRRVWFVIAAILLHPPSITNAAIIGTNVPSLPLTEERVGQDPEWKGYFDNSRRHHAADLAYFEKELRDHGMTNVTSPPKSINASSVDLRKSEDWYAAPEALRIATNLVSFQTRLCRRWDFLDRHSWWGKSPWSLPCPFSHIRQSSGRADPPTERVLRQRYR